MPRAGLTTDLVVEAAVDLVDHNGIEGLTLTAVADHFDVRPPSLYNHVGGLEDLTGKVAVHAMGRLTDLCRDAAVGRAGADALKEVARAYRTWALAHPGTYALIQVARPDDEWQRAARDLLAPLLAVLSAMGLEGNEAVHAIRSFRSALHGFVTLETSAGFGIDLSVDESFERLIDVVVRGIVASAVPG